MEYLTNNAEETKALAGRLAGELLSRPVRGALVLALAGELGAGKTTFIQGLAAALGVEEKILSPTFVIMRHFKTAGGKISDLYHLDAYRLNGAADIQELGLAEILKSRNNFVVIEWAEKIKNILPPDAVWLKFAHGGEDVRKILFEK